MDGGCSTSLVAEVGPAIVDDGAPNGDPGLRSVCRHLVCDTVVRSFSRFDLALTLAYDVVADVTSPACRNARDISPCCFIVTT